MSRHWIISFGLCTAVFVVSACTAITPTTLPIHAVSLEEAETRAVATFNAQLSLTPAPTGTPTETPTPTPTLLPAAVSAVDCETVVQVFLKQSTNASGQVITADPLGQHLLGVPRNWTQQEKQAIAAQLGAGGEAAVDRIVQDSQTLEQQGVFIHEVALAIDGGYGYDLMRSGQTVWAIDKAGNFTGDQGQVGDEVASYKPIPESHESGQLAWGKRAGCTILLKRYASGIVRTVFHPGLGKWVVLPGSTPALAPLELEKVTSAGPDYQFQLLWVENARHQEYLNLLDALARSGTNTSLVRNGTNPQFWREMGIAPTGQGLLNYLKKSIGGPENKPYWLPLVSPKGTWLQTLHGVPDFYSAVFRDFAPDQPGVYLDGVRTIIFGREAWNNDWGSIQELLAQLKQMSGKDPIIPADKWGEGGYDLGLVMTPDHRLAMVMGSQYEVDDICAGLLGGQFGQFRPDKDPQVATAMWKSYLQITRDWGTFSLHQYPPFICFMKSEWCHLGIPAETITPNELIFEPY